MALPVSGGERFTLEAAKENVRNILVRLERFPAAGKFFQNLWRDKEVIEAATAGHLGLINSSACIVQGMETWTRGQFNVCLPVHVYGSDGSISKKLFRCPMEHKVGEQHSPGVVDEKLRAEVAAYAWIEENCPQIPIPRLHGFGLSNKLQFTHHKSGPGYMQDTLSGSPTCPYMLLDFIDSNKGRLLSATLSTFRNDDSDKMQNLFQGISRIILSLALKAQSHIGSLRFNDDTSITLASRPIFCANSILEAEGAPRTIDRRYTTCGGFVEAMLHFRQEAFRTQPNAVYDEEDCRLQMFHLVMLRSVYTQLIDYHFDGPFVLQLTDFHSGNIFVDDDWNIVGLIDLEFICALPPSMLSVPYWLSVDFIDQTSKRMGAVIEVHQAFMRVFENEEKIFRNEGAFTCEHNLQLTLSMQKAWDLGSYWLYECLTSIDLMPYIVEEHICKMFDIDPFAEETKLVRSMSQLWSTNSNAFVQQKLRDKAEYDKQMEHYFGLNPS